MKKISFMLFSLYFLCNVSNSEAQGIAINKTGADPDNSAILDISSTNKGVLFPRMATAQRDAISSPATGLMIYQTDNISGFYRFNGTSWVSIGGTGTGASCIDDLCDGKSDASSVYLGLDAGLNDPRMGYENVGVGIEALKSIGLSAYNVAIGHQSLYSLDQGFNNTAVGYEAMYYSDICGGNSAYGFNCMHNNSDGDYNVAMGSDCLYGNTTGYHNVAIGADAGYYSQSGNYNTVIGDKANWRNAAGSYNTLIGAGAGDGLNPAITKSGNIFIGYQAGFNEIQSNKLYIENSNSSSPLIGGDFSTNKVTINDVMKLAPRTTAPSSPTEGEIYVNSSDHHIYCYLNGSWKQLD